MAHPTAAAPTPRAVMKHQIAAERLMLRPHHPAHAPLDRPQGAPFPLHGSDIDTHGAVLDIAAGPDHRKSDPIRGVTVVRADKDSAARHRSEQRDPLYSWDRSHGWPLLLWPSAGPVRRSCRRRHKPAEHMPRKRPKEAPFAAGRRRPIPAKRR